MSDVHYLILGYLMVAINIFAAIMVKTIPLRQNGVLQQANNCFLAFFSGVALGASLIVLEITGNISSPFSNLKTCFFILCIFFIVAGTRLRLQRPIKGPILLGLVALGLAMIVFTFFSYDKASLISVLNPLAAGMILWGIKGFFKKEPVNRGDIIIGSTLVLLVFLLLIRTFIVINYGLSGYDYGLIMSGFTVISFGLCCGLITANFCDRNYQLEEQATTDSMTGLMNRSFFNTEVVKQIERARRYDYPVSLIMCDLDYFKSINDTYGHGVGDQVIVEFSRALLDWTRENDICCRFGGEEFVLFLPHTTKDQAMLLANRICKAARGVVVLCPKGAVRFTASFGVSELKDGLDNEMLLKQADDALYFAKNSGRDCVKLYSDIKESH